MRAGTYVPSLFRVKSCLYNTKEVTIMYSLGYIRYLLLADGWDPYVVNSISDEALCLIFDIKYGKGT